MQFGGEPLGLDAQGLASGAARLFARPHDLTIVPSTGEHRLRGVVRRIHGIGPARRVEIALGSENAETLIEVDALAHAAAARRAAGGREAGAVSAVPGDGLEHRFRLEKLSPLRLGKAGACA